MFLSLISETRVMPRQRLLQELREVEYLRCATGHVPKNASSFALQIVFGSQHFTNNNELFQMYESTGSLKLIH